MERVSMLLLLLLPLCRGQWHSEYQGIVMTYYPLQTYLDGSVLMDFLLKSNSKNCASHLTGCPSDGCLTTSVKTVTINKSSGGFCQVETVWTRKASSGATFLMRTMPHGWSGPTVNGVTTASALILLELRKRSDTGKPNRSPQTTVLPVFRVPHNCQRDIRLLSFDLDGDLVQCRFADDSVDPTECLQCSPPSVLSLTPSCTLSFSATDSSSQGLYAVQLVMEDFPRTDIVLIQSNGAQEPKSTTDAISKIPVEFLLSVEASAPSCSPGQDLPRFVASTPEHGAQINTAVDQTTQIPIEAEVASSFTVLELVFSGPSRIIKTDLDGQRRFILSWTPVESEDRQSYPVCFSAQTSTSKLSSELRCVIVNVKPPKVARTVKVRMSSSAPLTDEAVKASLLKQIKLELEKQGLHQDISISLVNGTLTKVTSGSL